MSTQAQPTDDSDSSSWVRGVSSREINNIWFHVEHKISEALKVCPYWSLDDVKAMLKERQAQLFEINDFTSIVITRIHQYPQAKVLELFLAAGELPDIKYLPQFEDWARELGCDYLEFSGRIGWGRKIQNYEQVINMRKSLWQVVVEVKP